MLEERHHLLIMILDAVYVDMAQGLVLGLKPEFLPLFNLGEPVIIGDSELVAGGMEQSRPIPYPKYGSRPCGRGDSVSAVVLTFRCGGSFAVFAIQRTSLAFVRLFVSMSIGY